MTYSTYSNDRSAWLATSRSDQRWLSLYRKVIAFLAAYGLVVFAFVDVSFEVWLEAAFFLALFAAVIWPLRLRD